MSANSPPPSPREANSLLLSLLLTASLPTCCHLHSEFKSFKTRWWFQNLWACLLTAPPLKETHIPNLLGFNFLISNNHITSSPREAWGVFFKAYYCWNYLPPTSLDNLRTTILGIGFDQLFRETGQVSQLYSLIIKWPNYSLYISSASIIKDNDSDIVQ